jgi:hypothetical protein
VPQVPVVFLDQPAHLVVADADAPGALLDGDQLVGGVVEVAGLLAVAVEGGPVADDVVGEGHPQVRTDDRDELAGRVIPVVPPHRPGLAGAEAREVIEPDDVVGARGDPAVRVPFELGPGSWHAGAVRLRDEAAGEGPAGRQHADRHGAGHAGTVGSVVDIQRTTTIAEHHVAAEPARRSWAPGLPTTGTAR